MADPERVFHSVIDAAAQNLFHAEVIGHRWPWWIAGRATLRAQGQHAF